MLASPTLRWVRCNMGDQKGVKPQKVRYYFEGPYLLQKMPKAG